MIRNILFLFICCFYIFSSSSTFADSSIYTIYNNSTDSVSNYATNYTAVAENSAVQYFNIVANSSVVSGATTIATDVYNEVSNVLSGFFFVNPFSPNPLKPNFSKCFSIDWSVSQPSSSTAFVPQITAFSRIVIACIGYKGNVTLHGFGECGFIGLVRVCARNTAPCEHGNDRCCSSTSSDTPTSTSCNAPSSSNSYCPNCRQTSSYRICAFEDPMFPADITDNGKNMPFHHKTEVPPSVTGGNTVIAAGAFLIAAGLLVPGLGQAAMIAGAGMMLAGGIMDLIQFITSKMNYTVLHNHGCVDIPLTPFPPPWCSPIGNFIPDASIISICNYSADYALSQSTRTALAQQGYTSGQINDLNYKQISAGDAPCDIAENPTGTKFYSSFENPAARLYFYNPLPVCDTPPKDGSVPLGGDLCIETQSLSSGYTTWFDNYNLLPICTNNNSTNCITFPSGSTYDFPFRPLYNYSNATSLGLPSGSSGQPTPFVVLPTLPTSMKANSPSITFAGINFSKYIDSSPGNLVKITDFVGLQRTFLFTLNSQGDKICVYDRTNCTSSGCTSTNVLTSDSPVGCLPRPTMINPPTLTACTDSNKSSCYYTGSNTPSTQPAMIVSVGNPAKTGVIAIDLNVPNSNSGSGSYPNKAPPAPFCVHDDITALSNTTGTSTSNPSPCSIYNLQAFSAYLTDKYNQTPQQANNGTISPTYTPGNGISVQYANGLYCRGASYLCLSGYSDSTKKVVSKYVTVTNTSGTNTTSQSVLSTDARDRIIPPYTSGQMTISTFYDSSKNLLSSKSSATRIAYGSKSSSGYYYENLACSSDSNVTCTPSGTPTSTASVNLNCVCTGQTVTSGTTTASCSIPGCTVAFLTSYTSSPIEIGGFDSSTLQYYQNPNCTNNVNQSCTYSGTPTSTTAIPTTCKCLDTTTNTMNTCTISGCEWAFKPTSTNSITTASGFYDDVNNINYYDPTQTLYAIRDASPLELGLCVPITKPNCGAITGQTVNSTTAGTNGYADWSSTYIGDSVTGTCLAGTRQNPNGPPTRSCIYNDSGYEQIATSSGGVGNGCPIFTIGFNTVTHPCSPIPAWWPSEFLANKTYQGAIFNQFNVNYAYSAKFVPTNSNYNQQGRSIEQWVNHSYNNCHSYGTNYYNASTTPRTHQDGDQEMLFITAANWQNFWGSYDLTWLFAPSTNTSYNGCYVYDVTNFVSATLNNGLTVGMKICKYNDNISFSLVDTKTNTATDYTNNAYIMQSNILDFYGNDGSGDTDLYNNSGGNYINHGIVVTRSGFASSNYNAGSLPSGFNSTSNAESIQVTYNFVDKINSHNTGSTGKEHDHCNTATSNVTINGGCPLSVYRQPITYPYSHGNTIYSTYSGYYIPLTAGQSNGDLVNLSIFYNPKQASSFDGENCSLSITINNYVAGNSAANPAMFSWTSPTNYSPCNGSATPPTPTQTNTGDSC